MNRNSDRRNPELGDDLVMIGEIVKPHGLRGEVKVYSYSEQPENFRHYKEVVLQEPAESGTEIYKIIKSRVQGKFTIVQLEGVATRETAEALKGSMVCIKKIDFPKLDPDEYYWHHLIGLQVFTDGGRKLGEVASLFSTNAHDVMVITGEEREYLIPVNEEIIKEIDDRKGKLLITPPPGLLEANEEH
jgi:16S rRNA processing protein RimM